MRQQPVSPVPRLAVPEGGPPGVPEMPWYEYTRSEPFDPEQGPQHWPEYVFPGPEGMPDEDGYNPLVDPRRPPPEPGSPRNPPVAR